MSLKEHLLITIPHAGEQVPDLCPWLLSLPEQVLFCDVDRYVDVMYEPALQSLGLSSLKTSWHRYAGDLNRYSDDVDAGSVQGHPNPKGKFARGFHWQHTTTKEILMSQPMPVETHKKLVQLIYDPFHESVRQKSAEIKKSKGEVLHLDLHSMPSLGTSEHKDPGETRADIVVSDSLGKSARSDFVDLVISSYARAGFKVAYNWPYVGGRVTEHYGRPTEKHHCVQVEMSRKLYMNEVTKRLEPLHVQTQKKLQHALTLIASGTLSF